MSSSRLPSLLLTALLAASALAPALQGKAHATAKRSAAQDAALHAHEPSFYDFSLPLPDGTALPLAQLRGKTILLVNLARLSSFNSQLPALNTLSQNFTSKGLVVLGIPSDDFGNEEPGTDTEVQQFYAAQKLAFRVLARSSLRGVHELPLFSYLASPKVAPPGGDIHWNFTKFLINGKGEVVARFSPDVAPDSPELVATVQQVLDGTYAPPKKPAEGQDEGDTSH